MPWIHYIRPSEKVLTCSRCSINFFWVDGFYMIRDRSWAKSTAGVGKSRQAPSCDRGQLGLRKNHKRTSNRDPMRQLSHLGWTDCSLLPAGNWGQQTPSLAHGCHSMHIHTMPSIAGVFFTIQSAHRGIQERARGKPCPMEKQQDLKFGSSGCCHLLGQCPWAHFLNSNLESPC